MSWKPQKQYFLGFHDNHSHLFHKSEYNKHLLKKLGQIEEYFFKKMLQTAKFGTLRNIRLIWEVTWTFHFQRYGRESSEKITALCSPHIKRKYQSILLYPFVCLHLSHELLNFINFVFRFFKIPNLTVWGIFTWKIFLHLT